MLENLPVLAKIFSLPEVYISDDVCVCAQLLQEKEKQRKLSDGERDRELSEAAAQVERLKNKLKVPQKLNQLQSNKVSRWSGEKAIHRLSNFFLQMQEISTLIAALEQQEDCSLALLTFGTHA